MKIAVVGGGQAAIAFAAKMRELDAQAQITIVSGEQSLPYQRPPLSKAYMIGDMEQERLLLRPAEWYKEHRVDCILGTAVEKIDGLDNCLFLSGGGKLEFDKLLIATGSRPRELPEIIGGKLEGVYTLRDMKDADTLRSEMIPGRTALIIGGGYIGLEAAAVFSKHGLKVRVVEMADRILKRVASEETADFVRAVHRSHGVEISEGLGLDRLEGEGGRVKKALFNDGSSMACDFVVAGIGAMPNDELAKDAGLQCSNGIEVDGHTRTSHYDIHAAGDVANFAFRGSHIRLESVQNAIDQAEHAAKVIAGSDEIYVPQPWFWSDQYDMKLQIAGLNMGYDQTVIRPGSHENGQSIWYFSGGKFIAVDAINDSKAYMFGKKFLEMGKEITPAQAQDPDFDLKAFMRS
jgi:3-phenylpropionate/trans-cinnamate dioxygenase ferredoxin reductase subunit